MLSSDEFDEAESSADAETNSPPELPPTQPPELHPCVTTNTTTIVRPVQPVDWLNIARRSPAWAETSLVTRTRLVSKCAQTNVRPRDLIVTQSSWKHYVNAVYQLFSAEFWTFFLPLSTLSAVAIDAALQSAKSAFWPKTKKRDFALSKRQVMDAIANIPPFWPQVMCTADIDLQQFINLPQRLKTITFRFIDPVWAWLRVALRQPATELHWVPKAKVNPDYSHEHYYGAGVQFGESFAQACRTCPIGTFPMLVNLSWDGAHAHGIYATPICVGVGNTNSLAADTKFCIGYLPVLSDMGAQHEATATEIRSHIKQQCIAAILRVIESAARTGVLVRLPTTTLDVSATMTLMPRLSAINLDLKDARMYYGLRSETCCSKCKRRKGRSAFRRASKQSARSVQALYDIVEQGIDERSVVLASQKLRRWGFHPNRRCLLPLVANKALIRRPGHEDEVFPGVDFRDRMHGLCVFIHRQICNCFIAMKLPQRTRVMLDRRLTEIGLMRVFYDPNTGRSYRVQRSLFTEANMSAVDRMCTLFFLPHVVGHEALDFPEDVRIPLLTAISLAQIFVISTRGARSYNEREWREIFGRGWIVCFGALSRLHQISFQRSYSRRLTKHRKNPRKNAAPKEFKKTSR